MEELVFKSAKGNPVTTSLLVAIKFGKEHKDVIRAIKNLINSAQNCAHFYYSTTYTDSRNRHQEMFIMNRDGFSLLVMGFTGPEALQFKLDFIVAFNKMEQQLKSLAILPNFKNPVEAARAWADAEEKRQLAEGMIKKLKPKASYADRVLEHDHQMVDIGQAAKLLKLPFGRNKFFERLRNDGIFFKNRNEPKQEYIDRGYFDVRKKEIEREEHENFVVLKTLATSKGLFWLSKKYGGDYQNNLPSLQLK